MWQHHIIILPSMSSWNRISRPFHPISETEGEYFKPQNRCRCKPLILASYIYYIPWIYVVQGDSSLSLQKGTPQSAFPLLLLPNDVTPGSPAQVNRPRCPVNPSSPSISIYNTTSFYQIIRLLLYYRIPYSLRDINGQQNFCRARSKVWPLLWPR